MTDHEILHDEISHSTGVSLSDYDSASPQEFSTLQNRAKRERSQPLNTFEFYEEDRLVRKSIKRASEKEPQFGKGGYRPEAIRSFWQPVILSLRKELSGEKAKA